MRILCESVDQVEEGYMRSVRRIFRHRSMVAMMILIFLMVIGFLVEKEWIDRVEEERSFEQLYQEA